MRLKISFEDVKRLFNYLDKNNNGEIGYQEFTLLLEERWRGIDPVSNLKARLANVKNPMSTSQREKLAIINDAANEEEAFHTIEKLAKNKLKVA